MKLKKRYKKVKVYPRYSESVFYGVFDKKEMSVVVFSDDSFAIWDDREVLESFDKIVSVSKPHIDYVVFVKKEFKRMRKYLRNKL